MSSHRTLMAINCAKSRRRPLAKIGHRAGGVLIAA
jgi:hypothetical protein